MLPPAVQRRLPRDIKIIEASERESRRLNRIYRKKNKPANVLSFRYGPDYGEIILCPEVIRKEAKWQGNSYRFQKNRMIVHGLLHLAGIHHEKSARVREKFEQLEQQLLKKLRN